MDEPGAALARQRRELLAHVSHDMRTPMASMQGYLELLLLRHDSLLPAEVHAYLQTAVRQGERLTRLVGDLFDLTRLEADDMRPQPEPFALAELVQDLVQKFTVEAGRRGLTLEMRAGAGPGVVVHADIALIERLLDHLVGNALRHTPAGGRVAVEIGGDGAQAELSVSDTGIGIAAADLAALYDRYDHAPRVGNAGHHPGLGLGIARRIAELHGSALEVRSAPQQGTRVSLALPLTAGGAVRAAAPPPSELTPLQQLERESAVRAAALERSEARRVRAEAELRAAEQRYLLALNGSQDGLWEWDLTTGGVSLSPRWKSMLGFEAHELGDDVAAWRTRVHADDRAAFAEALALHVDGRTPRFDHEMRLLDKSGAVRHVLSRAVAIRGDDGRAYRVVGLDTDITRLRRVQAVLDAVVDGTTGASGADFFRAMVQHFARALEVDNAFIALCLDTPPTRVRTLAYWSVERGPVDNFEFALPGTPCEEVLAKGRICFHPDGLAEAFAREAGYAAYLGMPIVASDGRVLGHLAFRHRKPLGDDVLIDRVYRIFLARAAAEIERLQALARLAEVERRVSASEGDPVDGSVPAPAITRPDVPS